MPYLALRDLYVRSDTAPFIATKPSQIIRSFTGFAALETHECAGSASLGPTDFVGGTAGKGNRGR